MPTDKRTKSWRFELKSCRNSKSWKLSRFSVTFYLFFFSVRGQSALLRGDGGVAHGARHLTETSLDEVFIKFIDFIDSVSRWGSRCSHFLSFSQRKLKTTHQKQNQKVSEISQRRSLSSFQRTRSSWRVDLHPASAEKNPHSLITDSLRVMWHHATWESHQKPCV